MNELAWTMVFLLALGAVRAPAAEAKLDVLPSTEAGTLLHRHLLDQCQKRFDERGKTVDAIETAAAVRQRQKAVRQAWLDAIGPFPEKTPLKPRVVGTLDRNGYIIEKVIYESRPDHHVTANLYLPKQGQKPFPGVLVPCGHSREGKAEEAYQSIAILLAKHGFAVLIYDPIGQGERCQLLNDQGKPIVWGTTEHTLTDIGARLTCGGTANYRIWDGIRSLDYLIGRPEVDSEHIGCTGNSGGGTMTAYLMATDERILAAAPSCYITSLERLFATIGPQDGEQNITAQVARGIDHADYITVRAPKPTLVLTATKDFFDIDGSWATFREAKRLYSILGLGKRVDLFEYPDKHGFSKPRREAALRWMRRWLQDIDDAAAEGNLQLASVAELQCTESGQVLRDLEGVTVWDLNLKRAKALAAKREAFWKDTPKAKCLDEVRRLAGIRRERTTPSAQAKGTFEREGVRIERLAIERPGEVPVPALLFVPKDGNGKRPGVLYCDGRGKAHDAKPGGPVETLAKEGNVVLSVDLRGFGETAPKKPRRYWHNEYPISYLAIHLGRPLLGQRTEDALAALDVLAKRDEVDAAKLSIVGIGRGGPVALHAAALDERLHEVTVERSIESWMDVVATPLCKNQLNQIVPLALTRYDLPDLVRAIAPRPVTIRKPVDPTGKPKRNP
jgi:cephalosporin-C deacetylase-like acetyl esterase